MSRARPSARTRDLWRPTDILLLVASGSYDPDTRDSSGCPALTASARFGMEGAVHRLVLAGADPDAPWGATPSHHENPFSGFSRPLLAASDRSPSVMAPILAKCDPSLLDEPSGNMLCETALTRAASSGRPGAVQELLRAGASPNAKTTYPWRPPPPLWAACSGGSPSCVAALIAAGADPDSEYDPSGTFWEKSLSHLPKGRIRCVEASLLSGAPDDVRASIVQALVEAGARAARSHARSSAEMAVELAAQTLSRGASMAAEAFSLALLNQNGEAGAAASRLSSLGTVLPGPLACAAQTSVLGTSLPARRNDPSPPSV